MLLAGVCAVGGLGAKVGGEPGRRAAGEMAGEVFNEIGELFKERDTFYLRVDGRVPRTPGVAPADTREMTVRVEAMTRGRPWPGRWTMVEVEIRVGVSQALEVVTGGVGGGGGVAGITVGPGRWQPLRIPITANPQDVVLRVAAGGKLESAVEFGRVRLVDDREVFWEEGWRVERAAGMLKFATAGRVIEVPAGELNVVERGALRVLVRDGGGMGSAVYASGRVASEVGGVLGGKATGIERVRVVISDDEGRIERQSEGDADGDGYNEARGATVIRVTGRRVRMSVAPGDSGVGGVARPAIEFRGLPAGAATVLWEGMVVKSVARLADGTLLVELPGEVRGEQRVDVTVAE